ncbi:ATP-binding protein [Stigmatella sp. ncwal1]|uniref:ATP-binding protein n=1 Tax=Stigmatella ashevillensis TaxID=2995309 RepID=A0ABT5DCU6_9BACT|nr:ATP-binding protein [Stigmatella ashevillena]MDC0711505.1 ATP-binding protein [Stigmatella ashevillena]
MALLDEILDNLREQAQGVTRQHWLLRGPRGMGKTHLAGVIHYRVKQDASLGRTYLPLWLGEADTYEVYSTATLLKTIGERLSEETKDPALLERLTAVEGVGDEEGYFHEMVELLSTEADRRERVLLVLMENLDALLGSFGPKDRKEQTRQLRSVLLHNPRFLFISTTPTYYLDNPLDDPKEPLYAHLKERDLDPLTEAETGQLLRKLAQAHPREGAVDSLEGKDGRLRLRVIHRLTGGLPRSLVMAFTAIREATGIGSLVQELRALLDAQTAYFEARLAQLPARERAIVTSMALAPTNLTMKEIAARSHLPERTLSTLISRLEKEGHVRTTSRTGGKGSVYELSEGLFRLWYQYRKGRPVLEPLVEFLAYWYRVEELEGVVAVLRQGTQADRPVRAAELALLQAEEALRRASSEQGQQERERFWAECQQAIQSEQADIPVEALAKRLTTRLLHAALLLKDPAQANNGLESIQKLFRESSLVEEKARPIVLGRLIEAIMESTHASDFEAFSAIALIVLKQYSHDTSSTISLQLALVRLHLSILVMDRDPQRALDELDLIHASAPELRTMALMGQGLALSKLHKTDESIVNLDAALTAIQAPSEQIVIEPFVLQAMSVLSTLYNEKHQRDQAQRIRKQLIARFGAWKEEPFRFQVASAKASLALGADVKPTIHSLDQWLAEYGAIDEPRYQSIQSLSRLGLHLLSALQGSEASQEGISAWVESVADKESHQVQHLFHFATSLFILFGPETVKGWLSRVSSAQLSEETRLLVSWHMMAADLLLADEEGPLAQQVQARIPPELRPNVEDLVRQVRKTRAEFLQKA